MVMLPSNLITSRKGELILWLMNSTRMISMALHVHKMQKSKKRGKNSFSSTVHTVTAVSIAIKILFLSTWKTVLISVLGLAVGNKVTLWSFAETLTMRWILENLVKKWFTGNYLKDQFKLGITLWNFSKVGAYLQTSAEDTT